VDKLRAESIRFDHRAARWASSASLAASLCSSHWSTRASSGSGTLLRSKTACRSARVTVPRSRPELAASSTGNSKIGCVSFPLGGVARRQARASTKVECGVRYGTRRCKISLATREYSCSRCTLPMCGRPFTLSSTSYTDGCSDADIVYASTTPSRTGTRWRIYPVSSNMITAVDSV